jgi:hypothetical protein
MSRVDYAIMHFFVASDVGVELVHQADEALTEEVRACLASGDAKTRREGLIPYGVSTGLKVILRSEPPGPTGIQLHLEVKRALQSHNPAKEEMSEILKRIHDTLVPIWKKGAEDNRQKQLKHKRASQSAARRPLR